MKFLDAMEEALQAYAYARALVTLAALSPLGLGALLVILL